MGTLSDLVARLGAALAELRQIASPSGDSAPLLEREAAVLVLGGVALATLAALAVRSLRRRSPGRGTVVLPALPRSLRRRRLGPAAVRHLAFAVFLAGVVPFAVALADPQTPGSTRRSPTPGTASRS